MNITEAKANLSICNCCKNCVGRCSWSGRLVPVEGWVAEKTDFKVYNGVTFSYRVKECPQFDDYRKEKRK